MPKPNPSRPHFAMKPLALAIAVAAGSVAQAAQPPIQGLPQGGVVLPGSGSANISYPNANTMNVNQATQKVVIDWQKFNIDAGKAVNFAQPNANAVALNRIGAQNGASMIAGALNANGRVYLVNQNGIIFNGTARINTGGLLASSLDIDENQFVNSSIFTAIKDGKPALEYKGTGTPGDIHIENGAQIKTSNGGSVLIFAPNITNEGKIETPDGQTLMAAAHDKVYLMVSDQDDDYRGLVVEVGVGGKVSNAELGEIIAERGNVTLLGMAVNQQGRIKATTAVDLNGSVRLIARDGAVPKPGGNAVFSVERGFDDDSEVPGGGRDTFAAATRGGKVTLGGSIEITPDDSGKTAPKLQKLNPSRIEITGKTVVLEKGSKIVAPAAEVLITATSTPDVKIQSSHGADLSENTRDDARIFMEEGSVIDVSGLDDVELDMSRNVLEVELRGNELKDSPLQRDGILRGKKVKVDLRHGESIAIADISGAVGAIKQDVRERMTEGGAVTMKSTGDVVLKKGSTIDISGGAINYKAGMIESTKLLSDGVVYDISDADPNRIYDAIVGVNTKLHKKWNITENFVGMNTRNGGVWVDGYAQGAKAGKLGIDAHQLLLEGDIKADVVAGFYQRDVTNQVAAGELDIALRRGTAALQELRIVDEMQYHDVGVDDRLVDVIDDTGEADDEPAGKQVLVDNDGDGVGELLLSDDMLTSSGLGSVKVRTDGDITLERGANVVMRDGASLSLLGANVDVEGTVTTHGGKVSLASTPGYDATDAEQFAIRMAAGSAIDVSGRFTNDFALGREVVPTNAIAANGGSVALKANGDLTLEAGSTINANGGAFIEQRSKLHAGKGGDISLVSEANGGADITLDGSFTSYALHRGGKLSISASSVTIGDASQASTQANPEHTLVLDNAFFQQGGFAGYDFTANLDAMRVDSTANVQLMAQNRVFNDTGYLNQATGADMATFTTLRTLPDYQRNAGSLALHLKQSANPLDEIGQETVPANGHFTIETGARIIADTGGAIAVDSDNSLYIDGVLQADAGTISANIVAHTDKARGYDAAQSLWLGSNAQLISNAKWITGEPDANGLRTGEMRDAGVIRLDAQRGFLAVEQGARIEASGNSQIFDAVASVNGKSVVIEQTALGAAGSVELRAAEGILLDGDVVLDRAAASAVGGSLLIGFSEGERYGSAETKSAFPENGPVLRVDAEHGSSISTLTFGEAMSEDDPRLVTIELDSDAINAMDLDVLTLDARNRKVYTDLSPDATVAKFGKIEFEHGASLTAEREVHLVTNNLRVNDVSLAKVDSAAILVGVDTDLLGDPTTDQLKADVNTGHGALVLSADFIDVVGNVGVDNVAELSLASKGDIRLRSNLKYENQIVVGFDENDLTAAADINLLAQQIYPTSLSNYGIVSARDGGRITVARAEGEAAVPLSAAGTLRLQADEIDQGGVLRAPFGEIVLGGDATSRIALQADSITSISAEGKQIPLGRLQGEDLLWSYSTNGGSALIINSETLPDKNVTLKADSIDIQQGSKIDLSGGGDMYATEFIPGPGGSRDVLEGLNSGNSFAILPTSLNGYAPYDLNESRGSTSTLGATVTIAEDVRLTNGQLLRAGEYTVMPARYALQQGALLVTPVSAGGVVVPGQQLTRLDGTAVVAGKHGFANSGIEDAGWSAFAIEPGTVALTRSQYTRKTASEFFTGDKALFSMPGDAGRLAIQAGSSLNIDSSLTATHAEGGRGAHVDIAANNLMVTQSNASDVPDGVVAIVADDINGFGAESVLLGGIRSRDDGGDDDEAEAASPRLTRVDVTAHTTRVEDGASLSGTELILAATDSVEVGAGARVTATGAAANTTSEEFQINGDGALLQVSALRQALVQRDAETGTLGDLVLGEGSVLTASRNVVLDASHNMDINGADIDSRGLMLSAQRIVLGNVDSDATESGTLLGTDLLAALDPENFTLRSRSYIDVASDITVNADRLTLQAGKIVANDHHAVFAATSLLTLEGNAQSVPATGGNGRIDLVAPIVQLGSKEEASIADAELLLDAATVNVDAANGLLLSDKLAISTPGDLVVTTSQITALDATDVRIDVDGRAALLRSGVENWLLALSSALGAKLTLDADDVAIDTSIRLPSGIIDVNSGDGNTTLAGTAVISTAGIAQQFGDQKLASGGGHISLRSANGNVTAQQGSVLDVSGAALSSTEGSGAGTLEVSAVGGSADLAGDLRAASLVTGEGGALLLDAGEFANLTAQISPQFDRAIHVRQRKGDITLAQGATLKANDISIAADNGSVTVAGTLDASGTKGGEIAVNAGIDAILESTAIVDAHATSADGRGGIVSIGSVGKVDSADNIAGSLVLRDGALIDVRGGDNAAGNHGVNSIRQGEVHLRARRNTDNSVNVAALDASVQGADSIALEAFDDSITATVIDDARWQEIKNNVDTFMQSVTTQFIENLGSLADDSHFRLLPGIEIHSDSDITVDAAADLAEWVSSADGNALSPGVLTLRAAGDVKINASISDGFVTDLVNEQALMDNGVFFSMSKILKADSSWAYTFVAGADMDAGSVTSTRSGTGDFVIAANTLVRTGTGDIIVAAGGDVRLEENAALYTAGLSPRYRYATTGLPSAFLFDPSYELPYVGYVHPYLLTSLFDTGPIPQRVAFGARGGDIDITAGRDIKMAEARQLSSDWLQRLAGEIPDTDPDGNPVSYRVNFWGTVADDFYQGIATLGGGDIALQAGRDMTNVMAAAPVTMRQGLLSALDNAENPLPVTGEIVASNKDYFWERNGGGDVSVVAGGDVNSPYLLADHGQLSVIAGGDIGSAPNGNAALLSISDTALSMTARGDIAIDAIFNTTVVGQSILQLGNPDLGSYPELEYKNLQSVLFSFGEDTSASIVSTGGDVEFSNSINWFLSGNTPRFTYTSTAPFNALTQLLRVMPARVHAASLSGDVDINGDMSLFPQVDGQLELLAKGNVGTDSASAVNVVISDADPVALPRLLEPLEKADENFYTAYFHHVLGESTSMNRAEKHAVVPVHSGDTTAARIVAATGDIDGDSMLALISAKKTTLQAGDDIRDITLDIQNANASDTSELIAGDDIDLGFSISAASGKLEQNKLYTRVNGPGRLDVIAGGDVNLGSSEGIVSVGDQNNPALSDKGADVTVIAGASSLDIEAIRESYLGFVDSHVGGASFIDLAAADGEGLKAFFENPARYGLEDFAGDADIADANAAKAAFSNLPVEQKLQMALAMAQSDDSRINDRDYTAALLSFVLSDQFAADAIALAAQATGAQITSRDELVAFVAGQSISANNALARDIFAKLKSSDQRGLMFDIVYEEVRKGGIESLTERVEDATTQGFQRGYNAIEKLFPATDQNDPLLGSDKGNINLVFSTIASKDGGDVNFFTPHGGIDVGLAGSFGGVSKAPSKLGLIAQSTGAIRGISYDDININASRVFALDGGDIVLWSSQHDIDAGKGAKTAVSIPSPRQTYVNGEPAGIELPASINGSGIQAAVYTQGREPGSVYLFAPQGVIDAGDAGISSAGDLFLAATKVLGADNISFGGVAIGVPTATGISSALTSMGDAATASTAGATDEMSEGSTNQCKGDDCEDNNAVAFVTVEIIGLGD